MSYIRNDFTPLIKIGEIAGIKNIFIKDESYNQFGTFKDRLSRKAFERFPHDTAFGVISYGNTAISISRHLNIMQNCYETSNQLVVFVPEDYDKWNFGPSSKGTYLSASEIIKELQQNATVIPINLKQQILSDNDLEQLYINKGNKNKFINITEGLDIPAYVGIIEEVEIQLGKVPDICIVPFGAGILCNEIKDFISQKQKGAVIPISVATPRSLAKMLYGPIWVDCEMLAKYKVARSRHADPDRTGAHREPYDVYLVTEGEILQGLESAKSFNLSSEPSGAAGLGILHRLSELEPTLNKAIDTVVVINTGNGIDGFYDKL